MTPVTLDINEGGEISANRKTYKGTNSGDELRRHGLSFREPAPYENGVVRDLVWDLVREAGEGGRCADERRGVEGRGHSVRRRVC